MSLKDFIFQKELGRGSFGSVSTAIRKEDGKVYAIKRVKISQLCQKEKEYAINEIRILASFNHPNIIAYRDAFYDDPSKTINIVMDFADDGDIASKITYNKQNHNIFDESTIWEIFIQLLHGLNFLHENKVIHRDLKPANIFLTKKGLVKIGDLNVSKLAKLGMAQTKTGTPYYSSPEIWKDGPYNAKADIWSLGCIIYEMATLSPPFRGTSLVSLSKNIMKGVFPPIKNGYSKDLSTIINMMLQVNPSARPSTSELLENPIISSKDKIKANKSSEQEEKINLIKTIYLPRNMKDINKRLPHKNYEMMEYDAYEKKKSLVNADPQKRPKTGQDPPNNNNNKMNMIQYHEQQAKKKPLVNDHKPSNEAGQKAKNYINFIQQKEAQAKRGGMIRPQSGANKKNPVVIRKNIISDKYVSNEPKNNPKKIIITNNSNNPNYRKPVASRPQSGRPGDKGVIKKIGGGCGVGYNRPISSKNRASPKKKLVIEKVSYNRNDNNRNNKKVSMEKKYRAYNPKYYKK